MRHVGRRDAHLQKAVRQVGVDLRNAQALDERGNPVQGEQWAPVRRRPGVHQSSLSDPDGWSRMGGAGESSATIRSRSTITSDRSPRSMSREPLADVAAHAAIFLKGLAGGIFPRSIADG